MIGTYEVPCPTCAKPIHVHACVCPHCGRLFEAIRPWLADEEPYWAAGRGPNSSRQRTTAKSIIIFTVTVLVVCTLGSLASFYLAHKALDDLLQRDIHGEADLWEYPLGR